jgi:hypothetical protein
MQRDIILGERKAQGWVPDRTEVYRGKNYQHFKRADSTGQTPTTNSVPIETTPNPKANKTSNPQEVVKPEPPPGELSPQSQGIGDLLKPAVKGDKRSAIDTPSSEPQSATLASTESFGADDTDDNTSFMIKGLYKSLRNAKYSDAGAKVMLAHVGRENDFNADLIFGNHSDPHNRKNNVGFFSWQGPRREAVMRELNEAGLVMPDGKIKPSQAALDIMTKYSAEEMGGMSNSLLRALQSEDVDPDAASHGLSKRYIKWRHDDPNYASHHNRMRDWYSRVNRTLRPQIRATADPDVFDVLDEDIFG